jgi:hypothetical protein
MLLANARSERRSESRLLRKERSGAALALALRLPPQPQQQTQSR